MNDEVHFTIAQEIIRRYVRKEHVVPTSIMMSLLTMCREASDPYLSSEQQTELEKMIAVVIGDIVTKKD